MTKEPFQTRLKFLINESALKSTFFTGIHGEPTTKHVTAALSKLKESGADCVVAIGGGSVIDLAKAISVLAVEDCMELTSIPEMTSLKRLPLVAIPTTAGTGSEATKVTVITDTAKNVKLNPGHTGLIPDAAILDPELSVSLPKALTAYTGLDALSHAMEAYVSVKATPMSDLFAIEAIRLIGEWLPKAYSDGGDMTARERMLLGSWHAGVAFSNSSTNLAHAMARPLGTLFHIPHGLSVALLMPFVVEYSMASARERYDDIAKALGCKGESKPGNNVTSRLVEFNDEFEIWRDGAAYFHDLKDFKTHMALLVRDALSGNGILTNRQIPDGQDIENIYQKLASHLHMFQQA